MREFAVKAELRGEVATLRRGFATKDEAEDHPVTLACWDRVWVEEVEPRPQSADTAPALPWTVLWTSGHGYVIDADGNKIASLLGSNRRREHTAAIICELTEKAAGQAA